MRDRGREFFTRRGEGCDPVLLERERHVVVRDAEPPEVGEHLPSGSEVPATELPLITPWSNVASSVASGIVLTTFGATSSST